MGRPLKAYQPTTSAGYGLSSLSTRPCSWSRWEQVPLPGHRRFKPTRSIFLGDAMTYGISLAVIGTSIQIRARAAILKALSLTAMALWVLAATAYHVLILGVPRAEIMGAIGILALVANVASECVRTIKLVWATEASRRAITTSRTLLSARTGFSRQRVPV